MASQRVSSTLFTNANKEPIRFCLERGTVRIEYQDIIEVRIGCCRPIHVAQSDMSLTRFVVMQSAGGMLVEQRRDADIA
jgi:hypothetical protein